MERLLTTKEAAEVLGVSKSYLEKARLMLPMEGPPIVKVTASRVRYSPEDLERFAQKRRLDPTWLTPRKKTA